MLLNLPKTMVILLWEEDLKTIEHSHNMHRPDLPEHFCRSAKYLGLFVGPGKEQSSWKGLSGRFADRFFSA